MIGELAAGLLLALSTAPAEAPEGKADLLSSTQGEPADPEATYWIYVLAEHPDLVQRVRFGPDGAELEESLRIADLYRQSERADLLTEHEDPHGIQVSPDGRYVYFTTGHGMPEGKMWKLKAGTGELAADPVDLGAFPASMDVSPDGFEAFAVNFNLHGAMAPSSVSAVATSEMVEVERVEVCTMPHGSRFHPSGRHHYSVCMMDDQLVEVDVQGLGVSRRFFLGEGEEGPLAADDRGFHADLDEPLEAEEPDEHAHHHDDPEDRELRRARRPHEHAYHATCSPTWVQPSHDGEHVYVACNGNDTVLEIAHQDWELTRRFETGLGPYNVDVSHDDRILVATLKQGHGVEFIDLEDGESLARVDTSTRVVHGVTISPDDRYAFVSVEGIGAEPGKVDIFDLETFELAASVEVGEMASGIAFWTMER